MSKKAKNTTENAKKIKPAFSSNLEELLKEQGLRKNELAKKVYTTPQTISKACQGIRLTKALAESIVKEFPQYNISWIMGYSNLKYKADVDKAVLAELEKHIEADRNNESIFDTYSRLANDLGYETFFDGKIMTIEPPKEMEGYNPVVLSFSNGKLRDLQDDISVFLKYLFEMIIKRGQKDGIDKTENN